MAVGGIGKHEISSPDQRDIVPAQLFGDNRACRGEHFHQLRPGFRTVVAIGSAREQCGREVIAAFCGLFVYNEYWIGSYEQDANFAFDDARHKAHIHQHAVITDNVAVTEIHELSKLANFRVIIHCLGAFEFRIQRQRGPWHDARGEFLVFNLHAPYTTASGTPVLLQNTFAI